MDDASTKESKADELNRLNGEVEGWTKKMEKIRDKKHRLLALDSKELDVAKEQLKHSVPKLQYHRALSKLGQLRREDSEQRGKISHLQAANQALRQKISQLTEKAEVDEKKIRTMAQIADEPDPTHKLYAEQWNRDAELHKENQKLRKQAQINRQRIDDTLQRLRNVDAENVNIKIQLKKKGAEIGRLRAQLKTTQSAGK